MTVIERLSELGITLPAVAAPVAAYVPAIRVGDQVWTSGQLPFVDGKLPAVGKLGADITVEQGADYARQAALNALAAVDALVGINNVKRVLKIVGFVASADGFAEQAGAHARSAVGVAELPLSSPVEIEIIVEV